VSDHIKTAIQKRSLLDEIVDGSLCSWINTDLRGGRSGISEACTTERRFRSDARCESCSGDAGSRRTKCSGGSHNGRRESVCRHRTHRTRCAEQLECRNRLRKGRLSSAVPDSTHNPGRFTWQVGGTACCFSRKREEGEVCIAVWDKGDRIPVRTAD